MTTVDVNRVVLGIDSFGDEDAPLVLLAGGTTMLSWPDALCERLATGGRRVVRYDPRDDDEPAVRAPDARLGRPGGSRRVRRQGRRGTGRRPRGRARDRGAHLGPHAQHRGAGPDGQPDGHGVLHARLRTPLARALPQIQIPTLVVHGRRDPFFPVGNGEAFAREIPGARLLILENASTAIPDAAADEVAHAMLTLG